jgi:hypothetical protein
MEGHVEWTMAAPLWQFAGDPQNSLNRQQFRTPTILRFATDSFMEEFLNLLNTEPQRLNEFVAAPESWSTPPTEPAPPPSASGMALVLFRARNAAVRKLQARGGQVLGQLPTTVPGKVLKLYQPVHGRFYLVATCLVCRMLGLPDRRIDAGVQERATFVMRLLQPHADADPQNPDPGQCDEFALVNGAWVTASAPATLVAGEEQHPLSPAAYTADDQRSRRLLVGLVPVGDRERLLQAVQPNPAGQPALPPVIDARQMLLKSQVLGPLSNLEQLAQTIQAAALPDPAFPLTNDQETARQAAVPVILQRGNNQLQQMSWYVLLDLARYLQANLDGSLWQAIQSKDGSNLSSTLKPIWNTLSGATYSGLSMLDALQKTFDAADTLEGMKTTYPTPDGTTQWPSFSFQFYQVSTAQIQTVIGFSNKNDRATFEQLIVNALPPPPANPLPPRSVAQANANPQRRVWFSMRCVLERPNCGALTPPLVSEPTVAFELSPYFDPEAPSRPIRIGLPIDTTPAGLRKFDRNTAFVMSDTLCGQVNKMSGMSFADLVLSVLPFPFHKDMGGGGGKPCDDGGSPPISAGLVCSFSIPIITIVALILLIIFVKLLDIIFFWMPFFQICLPLPKFSAKDA